MTNKVWSSDASLPVPSPPPALPPPQQHAGLTVWLRAPSPPLPPPPHPPDVVQHFQTMEGAHGTVAQDPSFPPPPPSLALPALNNGRYCPVALEEIRRGKLRKVDKQTCELNIKTAREMLLKQIQQGVKLKSVSSDVNSDPHF